MLLTDTHSHIYLPEFDKDRDLMLERAEKEGVGTILMPAIDTSTHDQMLRLEEAHPNCMAMMGLHPCSVKADFQAELKTAREFLEKRPFVAVGEIGLDLYWDKTFADQQYMAFYEQIGWALQYNIPVAIHSRNATDECIAVVAEQQKACLPDRQGRLKGVFHCFSGDAVQAQQVIDLGFYLGIGGVVTFKNAGLDKVLEQVALENIVLETDAPYLAPVPFRGKRNEPSYMRYVLEKLAVIKGIGKEEVAAITTANAKKLFGI